MKSEIIITNDFDAFINSFSADKFCKIFKGEDFLLDNAMKIYQNAYIKEESDKYYILAYEDYSVQAQNYMLKLLEEPPANVYFKILVKSKNLLLATIKSRLISRKIKSIKEDFEITLDLKTINELDIATYNIDKSTLADFITALFKRCMQQDLKLSKDLLEEFYKCYELSKLNSNPKIITSRLLLGIMRERS